MLNIMLFKLSLGVDQWDIQLLDFWLSPQLKMGHFVERVGSSTLCHIFMIRERPL